MKIIGVSGGIGSGKSTFSRMLCEKFGFGLISADELSHKAAKDKAVLEKIKEASGSEYISEEGGLERKKMAQLVFSDEEKRKKLNSIIHPFVRSEFFRMCGEAREEGLEALVYDCPLLFEEKLQSDVDISILVYMEKQKRIELIEQRDGLNERQIQARFTSQMPLEDKLELCDIVFYNNGSVADMYSSLDLIYEEIMK